MKELKIGILSEKPEVKEVKLQSGETKRVANAYLFLRDKNQPKDENGHYPSIAIRLTAWDDRAAALGACEKGELVKPLRFPTKTADSIPTACMFPRCIEKMPVSS